MHLANNEAEPIAALAAHRGDGDLTECIELEVDGCNMNARPESTDEATQPRPRDTIAAGKQGATGWMGGDCDIH